jgi:hypothetical protein
MDHQRTAVCDVLGSYSVMLVSVAILLATLSSSCSSALAAGLIRYWAPRRR